ncbi:PilZ domain-containing protein [Thauera sinica]|uniref:PilZ domain-containing protein n=1 Tax=Thauera sinica TaxID=2665146 RepID=A0ABW1AYP3_9RHOO|nr:PilZ domain-containing protein [Thauera sp. K11]ATE60963.1 PilZ domain-containing protein [Thauera sp. K11]
MKDRSGRDDRRLDRRIPIGCPALIHLGEGRRIPAKCMELGVGGMTLHAAYVPGEGEVLEVAVAAPEGGIERPPLVARLRVKRCNALGGGMYEIGGAIVRVVG